jgi:hypothetical protein
VQLISIHKSAKAAGVYLLTMSVLGCDSGALKTYPCRGKVTFTDGAPLKGGWVQCRSTSTAQPLTARGEIQEDGSFELSTLKPGDGAVEGEYQVAILPPLPKTGLDQLRASPKIFGEKFRKFETSGLAITVTRDPDQNVFDIVVTRP